MILVHRYYWTSLIVIVIAPLLYHWLLCILIETQHREKWCLGTWCWQEHNSYIFSLDHHQQLTQQHQLRSVPVFVNPSPAPPQHELKPWCDGGTVWATNAEPFWLECTDSDMSFCQFPLMMFLSFRTCCYPPPPPLTLGDFREGLE